MKKNFAVTLALSLLLTGCLQHDPAEVQKTKTAGGQNPGNSDRESYKVLMLGDLHFDGAAYHVREPKNSAQKKGRKRNFAMWAGKSQDLLHDAASRLDPEFSFVIQIGDLTQGDCDTPKLQSDMFRDAAACLKQTFGKLPVLPVVGNHDLRLLDSNPRWNAYDKTGRCLQEIVGEYRPVRDTLVPFIVKEAKLDKVLSTTNYVVHHGRDLYIFIDPFQRGGVKDFIRETLEKTPDTRYVFLITHLTLLPCDPQKILTLWLIPDHDEVADLLAPRNAIILTGHTHFHQLVRYRHPKGTLTQLVISSMSSNWKNGGPLQLWTENYQDFARKIYPYVDVPQLKGFPAENYLEHRTWCCQVNGKPASASGYAVLKISDKGVSADIYTGGPKPELSLNLR